MSYSRRSHGRCDPWYRGFGLSKDIAAGISTVIKDERIKNWKPANDITGIDCLERHNQTDELFVLAAGTWADGGHKESGEVNIS